ncbi:unnamed protein product [Miscanthus lutarioriparius]|uniref:Auxin-responsive protein n=1 Tax=Miscanthus lutarioriparius TaxID=422564 RepID=A0A811PXT6_9POAL|nr:unnamed protein product [Miscanthus lutarioriparius]
MGDAAETSKILHNWMGEPRPRPSDQGDEEETLQLSLGLPGGGGASGGGLPPAAAWRMLPARDNEMRSAVDTSMLSLCYSAPAFSPRSPGKAKGSPAAATENARLASTNNASQARQRSPNTPVIGWPPVRAFRRNLATSSKASLEHQNGKKAARPEQTTKRAPFVKINMDGIPIGRKIDLNALGSYDELSLSVDKLFRWLLAAQQDPLDAGTEECSPEEVAISGLLDGTGEYTLVYEDYEGDRVLVGDVPWGMFVSSVKRLRVLKTSDLSSSIADDFTFPLQLTTSGRKRTACRGEVVEVGFIVSDVENKHVAPWKERHVGSLSGVPRRDEYGGVGGRPDGRDRVVCRACRQWLLVEGPDHGEHRGADRDAVVGDLKEAVGACRGANERGYMGRLWERGRVRSTNGATKAAVAAEEIDEVGVRNGGGTVVRPDSTRPRMPARDSWKTNRASASSASS